MPKTKIGNQQIGEHFTHIVQKTTKEIINLSLARKKNTEGFVINPLISIRIPTLNRSKILEERAMPSALGQTYKNIEVVVVGDHCIDDTQNMLGRLKTNTTIFWHNLSERNKEEKELLKDPEIRWFIGPVRATNKATELCSGEWVAHIDDDDFWTPTHLEELLRFAQKGNYEMVYGDYEEVRYGEKKIVENCPSTWLMRKYVADIFKLDSNCYKKEWNRVSDIDVFLRMEAAKVRIGHLKQVVTYVLPRPGQETIGYDAYLKYNEYGNSIQPIL